MIRLYKDFHYRTYLMNRLITALQQNNMIDKRLSKKLPFIALWAFKNTQRKSKKDSEYLEQIRKDKYRYNPEKYETLSISVEKLEKEKIKIPNGGLSFSLIKATNLIETKKLIEPLNKIDNDFSKIYQLLSNS